MLNEAVIALDLFNCLLNEGNAKSLSTMIQGEFLKKLGKKSYIDLSSNEKQELTTYIDVRSAEIKKLVSDITSDSNEQSFIYDVLMNKEQTFPEDFDDIKQTITDFTKIRKSSRFTGERDINKYKSFGDLHKAVYDFKTKIKERKFESSFNIGKKILDYSEFAFYELEDGDFKAFSQFIKDNNIAWCVKDKKLWNRYGSPYYYIEKDNKPFALLHYESKQFMDVHDRQIKKSGEIVALLAELEKKTNTTFEPWKISIYAYQYPDKSLTDAFLKFHPSAKLNDGLIDYAGSFAVTGDFVKEGKLAIKFGKVGGNFSCEHKQLTSLEGCPQEVGGTFWCNHNRLTSLEGCPQEVGNFWCDNNQLTSLEGAPQKVDGYFSCAHNQLTSLEGAPQKVGGNFWCNYNRLTSMEGCPQEVGGYFSCAHNQLTSLEGAPQKIGGDFHCRNNSARFTEEQVRAVCNVGGSIRV